MRTPHEFAAGIATEAQDEPAEAPLPRGVWAAVAFMICSWFALFLVVGSAVL